MESSQREIEKTRLQKFFERVTGLFRLQSVDVRKGNPTGQVTIEGDYYQVHGDFINSSNVSDPSPNTSKKRASIVFEIEGSLENADPVQLKELLKNLRKLSEDGSVTMRNIEKGSIKITLDGSDEGIEKILELFQNQQLEEIDGFHITNIEKIQEEQTVLKSKQGQSIYQETQNSSDLSNTRFGSLELSEEQDEDQKKINLSGKDLYKKYIARIERANWRETNRIAPLLMAIAIGLREGFLMGVFPIIVLVQLILAEGTENDEIKPDASDREN